MMFGPKKTSLLACVPICLAWVLMSRADDIYVVYTSRMLTGHILKHNFSFFASLSQFFYNTRVNKYNLFHCLGLGNGILTSSVYIVEVVSATRRGSVVMVGGLYIMVSKCNVGEGQRLIFQCTSALCWDMYLGPRLDTVLDKQTAYFLDLILQLNDNLLFLECN